MNYSKMTEDQLTKIKMYAISAGNANAAVEISEFQELFGKRVIVVKGRKVTKGTTGIVFWLKRYDNSKYGDPWGIYSNTRIGFKDDDGNVFFTSSGNVEIVREEE